jgi:hypothetical protein
MPGRAAGTAAGWSGLSRRLLRPLRHAAFDLRVDADVVERSGHDRHHGVVGSRAGPPRPTPMNNKMATTAYPRSLATPPSPGSGASGTVTTSTHRRCRQTRSAGPAWSSSGSLRRCPLAWHGRTDHTHGTSVPGGRLCRRHQPARGRPIRQIRSRQRCADEDHRRRRAWRDSWAVRPSRWGRQALHDRPAGTSRCTWTAHRGRWSPRSSTPTWCGTSGFPGWPRSTHQATSTAWSIPAWAGCSGGTARTFPKS